MAQNNANHPSAENGESASADSAGTDEYSNRKVPVTARKSFLSILVVALGYVFVVPSMQVGGKIGEGLGFSTAIAAILVGSLILAILACIMGFIGAKSGLSLGLLSKLAFGKAGTYVPVVIVVLTSIGWFSIDAYLIGSTTNTLFANIAIWPVVILAGIGMASTAIKGMKWMSILADIAVPLIIIFSTISMVIAVQSSGGLSGMASMVKGDTLTFAEAVSLGVGSYSVGAVMFTPDIARFAKSTKSAIVSMAITLMLGNTFVVLTGAIGALATGNSDIAQVLAMQGLLAPAFLVLVLNIWSTAQGCVYSGSLSVVSVAPKIKRVWVVVAFGIIGTIFALVGFYNYFGAYINFLASMVPALAGIFFADYLVLYRKGYPDPGKTKLPTVRVGSFLAWGIGFAVSFISIGLPVVNEILIVFVIQLVYDKISQKQAAELSCAQSEQ